MCNEDTRRQKQEQLLSLAGAYKGLDRRRLAEALGRDPTRLFPPTGNPKLDYLVRLADVLDWPVGDVAEAIWQSEEDAAIEAAEPGLPAMDFAALDTAAREAHKAGAFKKMAALAVRMTTLAATPEQRATAAHRESGAWDGLGRYTRQLDAIRRGLREEPIPADLRLLLQVNLANSYFTLNHTLEARALANDLLQGFAESAPATRPARAAEAFGHYVVGQASCRLAAEDPARRARYAKEALLHLTASSDLYTVLAGEFDHDPWRGIANTCRAGILEVEVELGARTAVEALGIISDGLAGPTEEEKTLAGDRLESCGWWCVTGCCIALRHTQGRDFQRHMAVFTNKGYEIADRLNNWAMRERLFTMEFLQRRRLDELVGFPLEWTIDQDEVRIIVGTMGRFPSFRSTGWKILQTAVVVGEK